MSLNLPRQSEPDSQECGGNAVGVLPTKCQGKSVCHALDVPTTCSAMLLLLTALLLGATHAIAPDHLAAVGVFVSRARTPREALSHGAHWGMGHALTLTVAGLAVLFVASGWPGLLSMRAEWLVGIVLLVLGARSVVMALRWHSAPLGSHATESTHGHEHGHRHPLVGIGMLHGLAGSGAMASIVPLSTGQQPLEAAVWLALFGVGTVAAMAVLATAAGWSMRYTTRHTWLSLRGFVGMAGMLSMSVGGYWLWTT